MCHTGSCIDNTPWLALEFPGPVMVTRVDIYNRDDALSNAQRLKNVEVRLTDELPPSGDQMFTGGQLLGTFEGPGTKSQIIKMEGPAKTRKYVLIQMNNRNCLNLHEVEAFGQGISLNTECDEQLDVVTGNFASNEVNVNNLLTQDEREWRADESTTKDQGFMLRIRGGKRNVAGIGMQNAAQPWASKEVRILGAPEKTGPWINLVEGELEETAAIQTFVFGQPQVVQFLKFELLSYAAQRGGGLRFFSHILGKIIRLLRSFPNTLLFIHLTSRSMTYFQECSEFEVGTCWNLKWFGRRASVQHIRWSRPSSTTATTGWPPLPTLVMGSQSNWGTAS